MKLKIINFLIIFWMLVIIGITMPEYDWSLKHSLVVNSVALTLGLIGSYERNGVKENEKKNI